MKILKTILWAAIEDYTGLWDVLWEVNTTNPELNNSEVISLIKSSLQELIKKDYIRLFLCKEPYGNMEEIDVLKYNEILNDIRNWDEPQKDGYSVRFSATDKGEDAYNNGDIDNVPQN